MTRRFWGKMSESLFGLPRGGGVASGLTRLLKTAHDRRPAGDDVSVPIDGLTSAEKSVLGAVDNTLATADQKAAKRLRRPVRALVQAAHVSMTRWLELKKLLNHPKWTAQRMPSGVRTLSARSRNDAGEVFDHNQGLVTARNLLFVEVVFIITEGFFWYTTFSLDIDRSVEWYHPHRISAVLLALLVPMAGVIGARLAGGMAHRWFMSYAGANRRKHMGVLVSIAVFGTVLYAVFYMVLTRFDEDNTSVGAFPVPAWAMALVFAGVLLVDMASRTFLVSEIREQYHRRSREFSKLAQGVVKANATQARLWTAVREAVQVERDQAARIETAGSRLLTDGDARWGDPARTHPAPPKVEGLLSGSTGKPVEQMRLPNPASLHLFAARTALAPSRVLDAVEDVLARYQAWTPEELAEDLARLWEDLHREADDDGRRTGGWTTRFGRQAS